MIASLKTGLWLTPDRLRIYPALLLALFSLALFLLAATAQHGVDRLGRPLGTDFTEVWAAGQEAREGQPENAYDLRAHQAKQEKLFGPSQGFYLWSYPPYFLSVAALLACFPYLTALLIWQAATLPLYLAAMAAILRPAGLTWTRTLISSLAFPAVFVNLEHGQNGFLTAALVAGGLLNLKTRPVAAGAIFACLAYKPQFAVMIPAVLIAGGYWRCILSGVLTLVLLTAAILAMFGTGVWLSFFAGIKLSENFVLEQGGAGFEKMQSVFAAARLLGAPNQGAYVLQAMAILVLLGSLVWLWRSDADFRLKSAALLAGTLLATPYSFDYDMVILAPALAMVFSHGCEKGFYPYEKSLFACVWLSPLIARPIATLINIPAGVLLTALFFFAIIHRAKNNTASSSQSLAVVPARQS